MERFATLARGAPTTLQARINNAHPLLSNDGCMADFGALHHIELRTNNLAAAIDSWGWLLGELGYQPYQEWSDGRSWRLGSAYIVLDSARAQGIPDRRVAWRSHLAFHAGSTENVERWWSVASQHGWQQLYADRWPWAGGPKHFAAFLENTERFKVELVASNEH